MSDLANRIRAAQVNAGELAVVQDLHNRGLCMKESCEFCKAEKNPQVTMAKSLETKIAMLLGYCYELRAGRTLRDNDNFDGFLDDPEVAAWLTRMEKEGRTGNGRFITR